MEYLPDKKEIILNRELNKLDEFVIDFLSVLEKYVDYVIVSGYVSIILGRSRATEDVDIFIKKINWQGFVKMYSALLKSGFWCINSESAEEVFSYINDGLAIRFARKGMSIPNFEVKFGKDDVLDDFIVVKLRKGRVKISSLEKQIAYKRYFLKSDKDIEDALHIEELFKDKLDYDKINKLKELLNKQ